jgi:hypothetical protein
VITELTVVTAFNITNTLALCEGESVTVGTNNYTTAGTYTDLLQSTLGCDSLVTTVLTVNPTFIHTNQVSICEGESITVGTNTYTTSGTYTDLLQTLNGCDSTIVTELTVNPIHTVTNPQTICAGGSYSINGNTYTTAGTYTDILQTANGCDSTVITELTVVETFDVTNSLTICEGESVTVGSSTYTISGTYTDVLQSVDGCDSLVTTVVFMLPYPTSTLQATVCEGGTYFFGGLELTEAGVYQDTVYTPGSCDTIKTLILTIENYALLVLHSMVQHTF